ncbi:unnamed protein product [Dibothriocephalus latus]|uniref:Uncharacterized protein n=1 Tax=Dibothriocephalus latus TaxID=60516 RepID=A0A3P6TPR5_DIBLA|nr:unnamed protein product [Dibothriocephalus latus]
MGPSEYLDGGGPRVVKEPTNAFEDRSFLMCSTEQANDAFADTIDDFGQRECEELLLSKLRLEVTDVKEHGQEPHKQPSLDEVIRTILLKAHVIRFDKLLECLRDRFQDKQMVNAATVIPALQRLAVLLCGWWVIKSEVLYPPNTYSEHASVPSVQLIRARDYVMAVFHRGDYLTRKTVSCITKVVFEAFFVRSCLPNAVWKTRFISFFACYYVCFLSVSRRCNSIYSRLHM